MFRRNFPSQTPGGATGSLRTSASRDQLLGNNRPTLCTNTVSSLYDFSVCDDHAERAHSGRGLTTLSPWVGTRACTVTLERFRAQKTQKTQKTRKA